MGSELCAVWRQLVQRVWTESLGWILDGMNLNHLSSRTFFQACSDQSLLLRYRKKTRFERRIAWQQRQALTLTARLMSQVGAGSSERCLVGDFTRSLSTSGSVTGVKGDSGTGVHGVIRSGSAVAVLARIFSIFPTKCDARSDAVC